MGRWVCRLADCLDGTHRPVGAFARFFRNERRTMEIEVQDETMATEFYDGGVT